MTGRRMPRTRLRPASLRLLPLASRRRRPCPASRRPASRPSDGGARRACAAPPAPAARSPCRLCRARGPSAAGCTP
eukprot:scaffold28390_cov109-Isochrysis_galbana.AAC.3